MTITHSTLLKTWDGGGGDQHRRNLTEPLFLDSRSYLPRQGGYRPRPGSSVLQPSKMVVGACSMTWVTYWLDPSIGTLQMP